MNKEIDLESRENLANLFEKFGQLLPQSQRQVMHLFLVEDLSQIEIAEETATTRQAVHDSIKKATKKLVDIQEKLK